MEIDLAAVGLVMMKGKHILEEEEEEIRRRRTGGGEQEERRMGGMEDEGLKQEAGGRCYIDEEQVNHLRLHGSVGAYPNVRCRGR